MRQAPLKLSSRLSKLTPLSLCNKIPTRNHKTSIALCVTPLSRFQRFPVQWHLFRMGTEMRSSVSQLYTITAGSATRGRARLRSPHGPFVFTPFFFFCLSCIVLRRFHPTTCQKNTRTTQSTRLWRQARHFKSVTLRVMCSVKHLQFPAPNTDTASRFMQD
jgi:hypothetical protein